MPKPNTLTSREIEIIKWIAKGKKNTEMAELLSISKNTIETHRKNILQKLNCNTFCEVIVYAFQYEILKIKDD